MRWLMDLLYLAAAVITAPIWLWRMVRRGKIRTDWPGRFGRIPEDARKKLAAWSNSTGAPEAGRDRRSLRRILLHAVSVGEVNAIRMLVDQLSAQLDQPQIVIATTTDTGFARATSLWQGIHAVVRYPFDVSWAVNRFLNAVQPSIAVLVELELWPNFTAACQRRSIPVCVVNGRLTERSLKRYRMISPLIRPTFSRIACAAVQNETYANRFRALGVSTDSVLVTGTMKWDTAEIADHVDGADALAREMGIDRTLPLVVAGSTAPGEHELLESAVPPGTQLLCAPRRPEWFNQAAAALAGCARRSKGDRGSFTGRFLLDTLGELRKAYALADVVVIGRSFGQLHGSDMMEPVALGKATIVGPAVSDFQDTVDALLAMNGLVQSTSGDLPATLLALLGDPQRQRTLASNGREVIRAHQGATRRHVELITSMLDSAKHTAV